MSSKNHIQSLLNINKIIPHCELIDTKLKHINILKQIGLFPIYESNFYKEISNKYNNQKPNNFPLIELSKKHIENNSIKNLKKDILMLVHPFYLYIHSSQKKLQSYSLLTDKHIEDSIKYIDNLSKILTKKNSNKYSMIFFEELDMYYQFSSYFLEKKFIDKVILTNNDDGTIINVRKSCSELKKSLDIFEDKNLYFAGGYACSYNFKNEIRNRCLDIVIDEINNHKYENSPKINIVEDLIMSPPIMGNSLFEHVENKIYHKKYSSNQILKLSDL